jgi:hypothetical protein
MKADLFLLCIGKKWHEMRKYLYSDAAEEEKRSNIMCCNDLGTCLHEAFYRNAPDDIIKAMIDIGGKESVMKVADYDATPLHYACITGASYDIIKILVDVGGKDLVMAKNKSGNTALHWLCSCIKKHAKVAEIIKLILQVGDANLLLAAKDCIGETPLKIATAKGGASNLIKKLLTVQSTTNSTTNTDSPSANIVPADNRTPITQSRQEQDTTQSSSTNNDPNIPIRGLDIDQKYQSQLKEATEKAKTKDKKIADLVATVEAQRVTIVALSNEKDNIQKECRDEVDKLTQMCSQRREELQLLRDSRNGEGTKTKYSVEEHQEEEGSVVVSQSRSQSSKRSRLESTADAALVASDRKQPKDGRLEMITCQLLNEKEQHSKLIQQLLDAWKELEDVKARNVQLEEDSKLD